MRFQALIVQLSRQLHLALFAAGDNPTATVEVDHRHFQVIAGGPELDPSLPHIARRRGRIAITHDDGSTLVEDLQGTHDRFLHLSGILEAVDEDEIKGLLVLREELIGCHLKSGVPPAIRVNPDLDLAINRVKVAFAAALSDLQIGLVAASRPDEVDDIGSVLGKTDGIERALPRGGPAEKVVTPRVWIRGLVDLQALHILQGVPIRPSETIVSGGAKIVVAPSIGIGNLFEPSANHAVDGSLARPA